MRWPLFNRRPEGYDATDIVDLVVRKTEALEKQRIEDVVPAGELLLPTLFAVASAGTRVLDFGGEISERCRLDRWFHPDGDGLGLFTSSPATIQHLLALGSPSKAPLVVPPYVIVM
jgi:hypothetical protein